MLWVIHWLLLRLVRIVANGLRGVHLLMRGEHLARGRSGSVRCVGHV